MKKVAGIGERVLIKEGLCSRSIEALRLCHKVDDLQRKRSFAKKKQKVIVDIFIDLFPLFGLKQLSEKVDLLFLSIRELQQNQLRLQLTLSGGIPINSVETKSKEKEKEKEKGERRKGRASL